VDFPVKVPCLNSNIGGNANHMYTSGVVAFHEPVKRVFTTFERVVIARPEAMKSRP
jgi:hypothetical protein